MKKDWIKEAYRSWFARLDEKVPEEVWAEIADELDIDEVWNDLSEKLESSPKIFPWKWAARAAAVFALLLSALAAYWYLVPLQKGRNAPIAKQTVPAASSPENESPGRGTPGRGTPERETPEKGILEKGTPEKKTPEGMLTDNAAPAGPLESAPLVIREPSTGKVSGLLTALPAGAIPGEDNQKKSWKEGQPGKLPLLPGLPEPKAPGELLAGIQTYSDPAGNSRKAPPFIRLQRLGVVSAYNNTWMLNHETFSGLQPSTLTSTTFTYGSSAGLNAGFLLKGKHKIGAELYLSSHSGQGYRQYIEARYQSRSIRLDYYKFQLYYQLPVFSGKGDILAGAYASYLKKGREEIAGEARTIGRFYRDIDYGLMAGYQFNIPVNNRLLLQPGIRLNYGLPNIFKGNELIPENFLRTHNAAAGLYLGVSYRLY